MAQSQPQIPLILPSLPRATDTPWSAEIVEAHRGLASAFRTSRAALNLDESDPIRLGHHLKQAETFMVSIVEALGHQTANPLPQGYIEATSEIISSLVVGLRLALTEATVMFVISFEPTGVTRLTVSQRAVKGFTCKDGNHAEERKTRSSPEGHI
jgi:hypothetical protein